MKSDKQLPDPAPGVPFERRPDGAYIRRIPGLQHVCPRCGELEALFVRFSEGLAPACLTCWRKMTWA